MGAWGTEIFSDDLAQDIRGEYNVLLSVGKSDSDAEKMLINYYSNILNCSNPDEDVFWFALALSEWKKGRLSETVKEKALSALKKGHDLERWNTMGNEKNYIKRKNALDKFQNLILSPMPTAKKIRKPTVHHCPWSVGSLLAYRIVSNKQLSGHPCFMKYVLLRVIKIVKHPISHLFDTGYYDESMFVGFYNWIGSEIPDPKIVIDLKYIPIENPSFCSYIHNADLSFSDNLPDGSSNIMKKIADSFPDERVEKCTKLDWVPTKEAKGDITYLDCDESFQKNIPDFFDLSLSRYSITHFMAFDITLSKRFEPYIGNNSNFYYVII